MSRTPEQIIRDFATLYLEVEAGLRPARHIRPFLVPDLRPVMGGCGRQGGLPRIGAVMSQRREQVWEAVVVLEEETRTSALVVSLRRGRQGWRVEEICRPGVRRPPRPIDDDQEAAPVQGTWSDTACRADAICGESTPRWQLPVGWVTPGRATPAALEPERRDPGRLAPARVA